MSSTNRSLATFAIAMLARVIAASASLACSGNAAGLTGNGAGFGNGTGGNGSGGDLGGGIANGITGDGVGGIIWMGGSQDGEQWRWVKQWLPHAAWYMVAITALER